MVNKVEICGVDTSKLPLLTTKEKEELIVKIKKGDAEARKIFINGNLRLVLSVIRKFFSKGENADDLFQIGCVGLIKAIDNFDLEQNVQFSTYAVPMIMGEVRRYLRDNSSLRVSRSVRELAYKIIAEKERFVREKEREPSLDELSKILGASKEDLILSMDSIQIPLSLQEPINGTNVDSISVEDQISDKKNSDKYWAETISVVEAMKRLNAKEKDIINKRFFQGKTQIEVADEIGISQAQVSRLEKNAILHIRRMCK